jgi:hypothetical protein
VGLLPSAFFDGARSPQSLIDPGRCSKALSQPDRCGGAGAGQPCSAHALLFPAAGVACGGAARGGPGVGPHQPADSFGIASGARWEPPCARTAQNKLKTRCPGKNFGFVRSGRCQVLAPGRLSTCRDRCVRFSRPSSGLPCGGLGGAGRPSAKVSFQQPSLSGAIECSHRIESGALPTASPSTFLDHGHQPTQSPSPREGARTCLAAL